MTTPSLSRHNAHRKAFGPRRRNSKRALGRYIADSILDHRKRGQRRCVKEYTSDPETIAWVREYLRQDWQTRYERARPVQSEEAQERRRGQQALLDSWQSQIVWRV